MPPGPSSTWCFTMATGRPDQAHSRIQIGPFGLSTVGGARDWIDSHNDGPARSYQELSAPLTIPITSEHSGLRGRMFMHPQLSA